MMEEIDLIAYRVHEANLKKKGGSLIPPKNSFREWDSVTGVVREEAGSAWVNRVYSSPNCIYNIKITIIYNEDLADIFMLTCETLEDIYGVINFIKENYEKFFNSDYVKIFRQCHMNETIKEVFYEIIPSEELAKISSVREYIMTVPKLNYIILGIVKEVNKMENKVYLHHLIARYKSNEKFLSEYEAKEGSYYPLSKEQLLKKKEQYKQQIADYIMKDGVYEAIKDCNI